MFPENPIINFYIPFQLIDFIYISFIQEALMYAFIVNPHARTGLGLKVWKNLEIILKEQKIEYQVFLTRYPNHASEFARALTSGPENVTLIALGGDGTINEVVNGIQDFSITTLGYIPIGSSNDFARSMKLSREPEKILLQILSPSEYAYINIGRLTYQGHTRRFAVSSGIGFDADVCFHNTTSGIKRLLNKLKLGKLSYTAVALFLLMALRPRPVTLTVDGHRKHFKRVFFVAAMNQRYEGGGFKFCPDADPGDDLLDIIVIADMPKLKALLLLPTAYKGWHVLFKGVHTFSCKEVHVTAETVLPVHTDGEPVIQDSNISFSLEPEKLKFICS